jgi:putative PIN family toxin of toxin-antitoxin system
MNIIGPKIVLDTNILIACIGRRSPFRWIFDAVIDGRIRLVVTTDILFEYQEVLARKTNVIVSESVVNFIAVNPFTEFVNVHFKFELISMDPSDNKFVDCAIAANADYIVSNDSHFQILKSTDFPKVQVLTVKEFDTLLGLSDF